MVGPVGGPCVRRRGKGTLAMCRIKRHAAGSALVLLLASSVSVPIQAADLRQALETAYRSNPTLNAQRRATRAVAQKIPESEAGYFPQVSAFADAGALLEFRGDRKQCRSKQSCLPDGAARTGPESHAELC